MGCRRNARVVVGMTVMVVAVGCIPDGSDPPTSTTTTGTTTTTTSSTTSTTTTTVVPDVIIQASVPASPSTAWDPRLIGVAPAATTTVRVFASTDCSGSAVASGSLPTFGSTGIGVNVGLGSTTVFTASASGPGVAACSPPFTYVNALTAPNASESEPNDGLSDADPIAVDVGAPADVAAHLDVPPGGGVGTDLFVFHVDAGRSIRIETFDWTGAACDTVNTTIYLAPLDAGLGGNDADSGIGACSRLAPGEGTYGGNLVAVAGGDYLLNVQGSPGMTAYRVRIEVLP